VGGDEYNMVLSTNRANTVRAFLIEQGVPADNITAAGLEKTVPVASNNTARGQAAESASGIGGVRRVNRLPHGRAG
jgi:outer membrane protein OmpA-like peptidoglycan-associated protein